MVKRNAVAVFAEEARIQPGRPIRHGHTQAVLHGTRAELPELRGRQGAGVGCHDHFGTVECKQTRAFWEFSVCTDHGPNRDVALSGSKDTNVHV